MAERPAWTLKDYVVKESFSFEWNGGFAVSQKKKNIANLHSAINEKYEGKVLEVSTKSDVEFGNQLSAFNLKINNIYLENIFQSSKKYQNGGPYLDMLSFHPKDAKRDERHQSSGKLVSFSYMGTEWELNPKTLFYDYIYAVAARETLGIEALSALKEYSWFTDIEFNPNKSINCQARSAALLKYIVEQNAWSVLDSREEWIKFHKRMVRE